MVFDGFRWFFAPFWGRFFFGALPHAFCLGQSALVGGAGEAWLRSGEHKMPKLRESVETGAERDSFGAVSRRFEAFLRL